MVIKSVDSIRIPEILKRSVRGSRSQERPGTYAYRQHTHYRLNTWRFVQKGRRPSDFPEDAASRFGFQIPNNGKNTNNITARRSPRLRKFPRSFHWWSDARARAVSPNLARALQIGKQMRFISQPKITSLAPLAKSQALTTSRSNQIHDDDAGYDVHFQK
jgi:hypothetical protein